MRLKPKKIINTILHYQCNICKEWLPKNEFYKDKRRAIGITSSCKKCHCQTSILTRDKEKAKRRNAITRHQKQEKHKALFVVKDFDKEKWLAIPNTSNAYFVSNFGRVKSLKWGKEILLKPSFSEKGYLQVSIHFTEGRKTKRIHRLVAQAFLPNPNNYKEINHKDEDKTNNIVSNLEWCDRQYNMAYGTWKERRKLNKQSNPFVFAYSFGLVK